MLTGGMAAPVLVAVALGLTACSAAAPAREPVVSMSVGGEVGGTPPGPQPLEVTCQDLRALLEAAGRPGEERWDVLAIRINSLALRAEAESDRTMLADLSDAARERAGGDGGDAWASAKTVAVDRCATAGVALP